MHTFKYTLIGLLLFSTASFSKELTIKEILGMTTGATVMPTLLPTYATIMHREQSYIKEKFTFFDENFETIKIDIAKGEGESLDTFSSFYNLEGVSEWKSHLQSNFETIFAFKTHRELFDYINMLPKKKFRQHIVYENNILQQ